MTDTVPSGQAEACVQDRARNDEPAASFGPHPAGAVADPPRRFSPTRHYALELRQDMAWHKQGIVLAKGSTGAWDADLVESPCVFIDPKSGQLAMVYAGYGTTSGAQRAGIGQ